MKIRTHFFHVLIATFCLASSSCQSTPKIRPADRKVQLLLRVNPLYPYALAHAKVTGRVDLMFFVDSDGAVREVHILKSPYQEFSDETIAAVKQWKFLPAIELGVPVRKSLTTFIDFDFMP